MRFHLSIQSRSEQMHACVRTEAGIVASSISFPNPILGPEPCGELVAIQRILASVRDELPQLE